MDMRTRLFTTLFDYIDFTAPTKAVKDNYMNLLAEIQADYFKTRRELSEQRQKTADLRFKNAELCEELFKLSNK